MAGNTQSERDFCINIFPDLEDDGSFIVSSDHNWFYNCIAFAIGYNDIWISIGREHIPWFWWPDSAPYDLNPDSLIKVFEYFGFQLCTNDLIESDYDKVALYVKDGKWTHAARVIDNGVYHSKLGECYDINHRSGDVLNRANKPNDSYGAPFVFMRRHVSDRGLLITQKPGFGYAIVNGKRIPYMVPSQASSIQIQELIQQAILYF